MPLSLSSHGALFSCFLTGAPLDPAHVRVVIRTHLREELQLRSLIYSLRAQGQGQEGVQVDFVLVPTEPASVSVYQRLRDGAYLLLLCECVGGWGGVCPIFRCGSPVFPPRLSSHSSSSPTT